jgi:hypothetical protein
MKTRYIGLFQSSVIAISIVSLMAGTSSLLQPPVVTEVARKVTPATPALTEKTTPTATRTATTTQSPTATLTNSPIDITQPTEPPSSYPAPAKPILLAFGIFGGDGGTSYDIFFGRDMPSLILYSDGQLLTGGFSDTDLDGYSQKMLSPSETCTLLQRLEATGYYEVEGTGYNYPNDSICRTPEYFGDGGGDYILWAYGEPSKGVSIYSRALDNLVPQVEAAYQLVSNYHPSGMSPFVSDRAILRIEQQPGEDWFGPTPTPPQIWPSDLPTLAELLKGQLDGRNALLEGQTVNQLRKLMRLPGSGMFTENGKTYFVVARPLLPHETENYFSVDSWVHLRSDSSVDLPFKCDE